MKEFSKRWEKSNVSLENYKQYLSNSKPNKFILTIIDLLYISNFKGGNATINVKEDDLNIVLQEYSLQIRQIQDIFGSKRLMDLNNEKVEELIRSIYNVVELTRNDRTAIDGFKSSYLSALLHAFFPELIPILDRRILINMKIIENPDLLDNTSKQVKGIENYYDKLIREIHVESQKTRKSVREIDGKYFSKELPNWAKLKSKAT